MRPGKSADDDDPTSQDSDSSGKRKKEGKILHGGVTHDIDAADSNHCPRLNDGQDLHLLRRAYEKNGILVREKKNKWFCGSGILQEVDSEREDYKRC